MKHLQLDILVAHAPCLGPNCPELALTEWWRDLQHVVQKRAASNIPMVCLLDTNAAVGSTVSSAIGPYRAETENYAGDLFHQFLVDNELFLPSTFEDCAKGEDTKTWVSPDGLTTKRIDFIAIPTHWPMWHVWAYVWKDLDLMAKRDDHLMVVVEAVVPKSVGGEPLVRWRAPVCDKSLMRDKEKCIAFATDLQRLPPISWQTHADQHLATTAGSIRTLLAEHFPRQQRPRKPWISDGAWALILQRRAYRKTMRQATRKIMMERVAIIFDTWKRVVVQTDGTCLPLLLLPPMANTLLCYAYAMWQLDGSLGVLRKRLETDRRKNVEQVKDIAARAAARNDTNTLYTCVRKLKGSKVRPPAGILLEDGTPASNPLDVRRRWQRHFASVMAGEICSQSELVSKASHVQSDHRFSGDLDASTIPSLIELEGLYASTARGKAAGVDSIPPEAFAIAPQAMARLFHPIVVKSALRFEEPLAWKGGTCIELFKGKGAFLECKSYRDVLVSDIAGKVYHKAVRSRVLPLLGRSALDTQCGGVESRGADFGGHIVRQFLDLGKAQGKSVAVVFVDVVGAFASVIREIVLGGLTEVGQIAALCSKLGLDQALGQEIIELARRGGVIDSVGASPHLMELLRESHCNTWFSTEGLDDIVRTDAGTRAGDPLADVMFNLLMAAVLQRLRLRLRSQGLTSHIPWPPEMPPIDALPSNHGGGPLIEAADVSYVDDAAVMIQSAKAEGLAERVTRATAEIIDTFAQHGLVVNMKPGKTEAIMSWRGPGSRHAKRKVLLDGGSIIKVRLASGEECSLRIVDAYKHLGGYVAADASMRREIGNRASSGMTVYMELRKPIFADRRLPLATKSQLADALVDSRHFYNAAIWPRLPERELKRVEISCAKPYRTMLGLQLRKDAPLVASGVVLQCSRATSTKACVSLARLRYLPRLTRSAPPLLHALIVATSGSPDSWMAALKEDLGWLRDMSCRSRTDMPHPDNIAAWMRYAADSRQRWSTMLKNAVAEENRRNDMEMEDWKAAPVSTPSQNYVCAECSTAFGTQSSLNAHFAKVHTSAIARRYAEGDVCRACLKRFSSRSHVIHHLAFSKRRCLQLLIAQRPPLSMEEAAEMDAEDCQQRRIERAAGRAPRSAVFPAHRLHGPLPRQLPVPRTPPGLPPSEESEDDSAGTLRQVRLMAVPSGLVDLT